MSNFIKYTVEASIATIAFNRIDAMNAFDQTLGYELEATTERAALDPSIRAVVLKGEGALFMAGGDLHYFKDHLAEMPSGVRQNVRLLSASIRNLIQMPKPVLAVVHGAVAGAGISLMLAADLVIAAEDTLFNLAYTNIGTSPDGGASYFLPRLVGTKKAMELCLLSERFDAKTALDLGLINWIESRSTLPERVAQLTERLAHGPTQAYAHTKNLINNAGDNTLEQHFEQEALGFVSCSQTHDFKEGVTAFLGKRKANFRGS